MRKIFILVLFVTCLVGPVLFSGCRSAGSSGPAKNDLKAPDAIKENTVKTPLKKEDIVIHQAAIKVINIAFIKSQKGKLLNQTVIVKGQYMGWSAAAGAPPVTRSDWVLKDETGMIYVTGKLPLLDPVKNKGQALQVTATVATTTEGQIYLKSQTIQVLPDSDTK